MSIAELIQTMNQGRELEFSLLGNSYFLSPVYIAGFFVNQFSIYDNNQKKVIFTGSLNEVINYHFLPNMSLAESINMFNFEYFL